jgi:DNA-binding cell septation regulator SpoVG
MTVKFSLSFKAKQARIARLPKLVEDTLHSATKGHAVELIQEFQKGLRNNSFGLTPLKEATIEGKIRNGYSKPDNPLYGLGDRSDKSYVNMMRIRKLKNGYRVQPSKGKHHKSGLALRDLFVVHEYGCTIVTKTGVLIRIPPRPAMFKAYERMMHNMQRDKRETSRNVKKAIGQYISTGKENLFQKMKEGDWLGHEDYEKND